MPVTGETLVVAVSGGADSLSLLLALEDLRERKKLDCRIIAAHFNHKLRGAASEADEDFVRNVASERGFELAVGRGEISQTGNLEQNAREARYAFLAKTAANVDAGCILTAHTVNDQAETFLLNLIRGSGFDGLAAMPAVRTIATGPLATEQGPERPDTSPLLPFNSATLLHVRPLLRWAKREDTENFCRESSVEFRYDTMNEDMSFKRVRVRKMLLPMLKEFNPKIIETLARTAELMQTAPAASPDPQPDEVLSIKHLVALERTALRQTLRSWVKLHRGNLRMIGQKHIEAIERLALSNKSGRTVELPGFGRILKKNGTLAYENIKVD